MCKRLATGLVQDVCSALGENFSLYLQDTIPMLIRVLEHEQLTPDVKVHAIMALGDICLMCETQFRPYVG